MKKLIFLIVLSLFMITNVRAINGGDNGYVIEKYLVDIKVNEDNSLEIEERITANFKVNRHGIIRKIPLKNQVIRLDETYSYNRIKVTNVSVNVDYKKSVEGNYLNLKIGDANKTVKGLQEYVIKYTYDIGKDPLKDKDELYFNIIGIDWDTSISKVNFRITMPKDFDANLLGFSSGTQGQILNDKIIYEVKDQVIIGKYNGVLNPYEGITVRCELPEGYFIYHFKIDFIYIIPLISLILSFFIWFIYGRNHFIETVEFYPPEGYNSLEIGYLYKGYANDKDVISLLIYLANKGYIKIEEMKSDHFLTNKNNYKFTRLKDYEGENQNEKMFMSGFFRKTGSNEIEIQDLENKFFITSQRIKNNINNRENKKKMFDQTSKRFSLIIVICLFIPFLVLLKNIGFTLIFPLLFVVVGLTVVIFLFQASDSSSNSGELNVRIFALIWGAGFIGIPLVAMIIPMAKQLDLIPFLFEFMICLVLMVILICNMKKRTKEGSDIYGKIRGFRKYLQTVEKEKLESMVMANPSYFYDILPYTYVLGLSDKWIKKFEGITIQEPYWYSSNERFTLNHFGNFMDTSFKNMSSLMTSVPTSSSEGGSSQGSSSSSSSSGGGSSGGGSGGGGGSSW